MKIFSFELFPSSKIDFWPFLKLQKMEFGQKKIFCEIDLFDFTSFFGLVFLKFSGPLCYYRLLVDLFRNESLIFFAQTLYCTNTIFHIVGHFFIWIWIGKEEWRMDEHKMKPYFQRVGRRVRHDLPYKYMILLCFYFFFGWKKISVFFFFFRMMT